MIVEGVEYRLVLAHESIEACDRLWVKYDPDGIFPAMSFTVGCVGEDNELLLGKRRDSWVKDDNYMYEVWRPVTTLPFGWTHGDWLGGKHEAK